MRRPPSPSTDTVVTFADLGVPGRVVTALCASRITVPFPIQVAAIPDALAGHDVLGRAGTGSGKTYAFAIPMLVRLTESRTPRRPRRPRGLILVPTRELAAQITTAMAPLAGPLGLRVLAVAGGASAGRQIAALAAGVDIVVACPGRLEDHLSSGRVSLDSVEIAVLDEADMMADLGFLPAVCRLLDRTPSTGQRMLFSATLDRSVDAVVQRYLNQPVHHTVAAATHAPTAPADHHVLHVQAEDRLPVLVDLAAAPGRTIVFTRTKHGASSLTRRLVAAGVSATELHGNLAQTARNRNLQAFTVGSVTTLVATDIAARGIHVDDVRLIIHADPPDEHKAYLHRSGRTARAGRSGTVVTLATDAQLRAVRHLTGKAGVVATTTRVAPGHPLLVRLAPGHRVLASGRRMPRSSPPTGSSQAGSARRRRPARTVR